MDSQVSVISEMFIYGLYRQMSLMKEVRNLIGPRDIDRFDMLVLKREVDAMKVGYGSYVITFEYIFAVMPAGVIVSTLLKLMFGGRV